MILIQFTRILCPRLSTFFIELSFGYEYPSLSQLPSLPALHFDGCGNMGSILRAARSVDGLRVQHVHKQPPQPIYFAYMCVFIHMVVLPVM